MPALIAPIVCVSHKPGEVLVADSRPLVPFAGESHGVGSGRGRRAITGRAGIGAAHHGGCCLFVVPRHADRHPAVPETSGLPNLVVAVALVADPHKGAERPPARAVLAAFEVLEFPPPAQPGTEVLAHAVRLLPRCASGAAGSGEVGLGAYVRRASVVRKPDLITAACAGFAGTHVDGQQGGAQEAQGYRPKETSNTHDDGRQISRCLCGLGVTYAMLTPTIVRIEHYQ